MEVRQSCFLSPSLFNTCMDLLMRWSCRPSVLDTRVNNLIFAINSVILTMSLWWFLRHCTRWSLQDLRSPRSTQNHRFLKWGHENLVKFHIPWYCSVEQCWIMNEIQQLITWCYWFTQYEYVALLITVQDKYVSSWCSLSYFMAVRHEYFYSVSKQQRLMRLIGDSLSVKYINANYSHCMVMWHGTQKLTLVIRLCL